jgi:hypothetical protein
MDSLSLVDYSSLVEYFRHGSTWLLVAIAVGAGAIGGFVHRYAVPPADRGVWYAGILMGAAGAVAFMFIMIPDDPFRFLAVSLVAGFGGKAIIESVLESINAKIVRRNSAPLISRARELAGEVRQTVTTIEAEIKHGRLQVSQGTLDMLKESGQQLDDKQKELKSLQARAEAK